MNHREYGASTLTSCWPEEALAVSSYVALILYTGEYFSDLVVIEI